MNVNDHVTAGRKNQSVKLIQQNKDCQTCPYFGFSGLKDQVVRLIEYLRSVMYPEVFGECINGPCQNENASEDARSLLSAVLSRLVKDGRDPRSLSDELIAKLPEIRDTLETDIQAAYEGDPAARSREEIMLAYPGFEAISIFRLAHELYKMNVPILPRMMTEYAHRNTGIDIHPGASIGRYFFIDHGTGVVVGETTTIGDHVKLYQGVTLGARSFKLNADGTPVKGIKRHPDIGNWVVIYADATILGGETKIGDHCVIGGNIWLTHSVEAGKKVAAAHEQSGELEI